MIHALLNITYYFSIAVDKDLILLHPHLHLLPLYPPSQ